MRTIIPRLVVGSAADIGLVHEGVTRWYATRVRVAADVYGLLSTDWPAQPGCWLALRAGQPVQLAYTTRGSVSFVDATLVAMRADAPPALDIRLEGDWRRIERRRSQRFPISLATSLEGQIDRTPMVGTLNDVSLNGVRVSINRQLKLRDRLELSFALPDALGPARARASVVRVERPGPDSGGLWTYGFQFESLSELERSRIAAVFGHEAEDADAGRARRWWMQGWLGSLTTSH